MVTLYRPYYIPQNFSVERLTCALSDFIAVYYNLYFFFFIDSFSRKAWVDHVVSGRTKFTSGVRGASKANATRDFDLASVEPLQGLLRQAPTQ